MRFQRLRLSGFKSFVDTAELTIERGLTGVVGPNGCGKSNLLEAIRWTMGESSARSLRGGGMEDVIFAGTAARPSRDFAEVTLVLDNSARTAPVGLNDDDTLEVTRRIERGAGSAYRINGRDVRARDVALLFADAATGAHSPALVSQGRIGAVIAARPTERRAMLEEAAGIAGLHVRRKDAEQKLRATENNLARLDDVMQQMDGQIASLKRQARAAERYRQLSDQISVAEAQLVFVRWREASSLADHLRAEANKAEMLVRIASEALTEAADAQSRNAHVMAGLRAQDSNAREEAGRVEAALAALEAEKAAYQRRAAELHRATQALEADKARETSLAADARAALSQLEEEKLTLTERLQQTRLSVNEIAEGVAAAEQATDQAERAMAEAMEKQAAVQAQVRMAEGAVTQAETQVRRLAADLERQQAALDALDADDSEARRLADAEQEVDERAREIERWTAALADVDRMREQLATAREGAQADLARCRATLATLKTERQSVARLAALPQSAERSALAQVRAEPGYEKALAAALGDDLDAAVGEVDAVRSWLGSDEKGDADLPSGLVCLAAHVTAPAEMMRRLRQVGVVDRDDGQISLAIGQRLVTREGVLRRWDGFVARGSGAAAAERMVQANRLAAIDAVLPAAEEAVTRSQLAAEQCESDYQSGRRQEAAARQALQEAEQGHRKAEATRMTLGASVARRSARRADLAETVERLRREEAEAGKLLLARQADQAAQPDLDVIAGLAAEARRTAETARARLAESRARQGEVLRNIAADQEREVAIGKETEAWTERAATASARDQELSERAVALEEERQALAELPDELALRGEALANDTAIASEEKRRAQQALDEGQKAAAEAERQLAHANEALATAREARAGAIAHADAQEARRTELNRLSGEKFQCPPPLLPQKAGFDGDDAVDASAVSTHLDKLIADRDRLGPVNLVAERELTEFEDSRSSAIAEREELEQAIHRLRGSIGALNREGRVRLLAAFEQVDQHFRSLFTTLFMGGSAHLALVDSDDPLEAGLEIMAEPPGKKLTTLTLLSGGEQALTAVALVFALFLTNPAPICVLDEVDAPLDDANVERFCDLLDRMANETDTRFLIVTHNAVTMSRMHRLYGVTMVERGVSRLVSVDLRGAESLLALDG